MLPPDFQWTRRYQYDRDATALCLNGKQVAMMLERVDGIWFARLECHWPITAPMVTRDCQSLESGRAGIEAWAVRHEARLREEVSSDRAALIRGLLRGQEKAPADRSASP